METLCLEGVDELIAAVADVGRRNASALIANRARGDFAWFEGELRGTEALIADYDGTLIAGSQWKAVASLFPPDVEREDREEAAGYFARERGEPSVQDVIRFTAHSVRRMRVIGLHHAQIVRVAEQMVPRYGAVDLVRSYAPDRAAIVSFGIHPFIQAWCVFHGIAPMVAATHLRFNAAHAMLPVPGTVRGIDPLTMVTTHNKGYVAIAIGESFDVPGERTLVVGDSPSDMHMMGEDNLSVLVVPHADAEPERVRFRLRGIPEMWPRVAAVLVSDSLEPLVAMRNGYP